MYEQLRSSRSRLAAQLSAANRHAAFLEESLRLRALEVSAASNSFAKLGAQRNKNLLFLEHGFFIETKHGFFENFKKNAI
jgi:hypothetical protein